MTDWHSLAATVDEAVDNQFGEPIAFTAWSRENDFDPGNPDPDRSIPAARGCYVNTAARVMPAAGLAAGKATAVNADLLFSIRDIYLVGVQQKDRVYLEDRNFTGEIAFIEPGDTDRSILHLLRVKE